MTKSKEDAVSPVIGVILMVAVTVILAAVIAAFVFGMGSNISKTKVVAATAVQSTDNVIHVTYQGGQDAGAVSALYANVNGVNLTTSGTTVQFSSPYSVGSEAKIAGTPGQDHVVVNAVFTDGSSQVILDTYV